MSSMKIFQRARGYNMYQKLVQTDQGYQSHQLLSDLNSYRRWYWLLFKTAGNPSLKILTNMTKKTKYSFWLQKVVKMQKQYHSWKLWRLVIYEFHRYFSRQPALEGSTAKRRFFFSVLCGKTEKRQNTFFGYKKWSKSKSDNIFRSATQNLYMFDFNFSLNMSASYL